MAETGAMTATQAVPPPRKHRHRYHGLIAFRLLSECETIPGLRTLGNLRLLRTSCPRTRNPKDPHGPGRTTRTVADVARPRPAHRLGRARPDPLSTATSFRRRHTTCPQSTSPAS